MVLVEEQAKPLLGVVVPQVLARGVVAPAVGLHEGLGHRDPVRLHAGPERRPPHAPAPELLLQDVRRGLLGARAVEDLRVERHLHAPRARVPLVEAERGVGAPPRPRGVPQQHVLAPGREQQRDVVVAVVRGDALGVRLGPPQRRHVGEGQAALVALDGEHGLAARRRGLGERAPRPAVAEPAPGAVVARRVELVEVAGQPERAVAERVRRPPRPRRRGRRRRRGPRFRGGGGRREVRLGRRRLAGRGERRVVSGRRLDGRLGGRRLERQGVEEQAQRVVAVARPPRPRAPRRHALVQVREDVLGLGAPVGRRRRAALRDDALPLLLLGLGLGLERRGLGLRARHLLHLLRARQRALLLGRLRVRVRLRRRGGRRRRVRVVRVRLGGGHARAQEPLVPAERAALLRDLFGRRRRRRRGRLVDGLGRGRRRRRRRRRLRRGGRRRGRLLLRGREFLRRLRFLRRRRRLRAGLRRDDQREEVARARGAARVAAPPRPPRRERGPEARAPVARPPREEFDRRAVELRRRRRAAPAPEPLVDQTRLDEQRRDARRRRGPRRQPPQALLVRGPRGPQARVLEPRARRPRGGRRPAPVDRPVGEGAVPRQRLARELRLRRRRRPQGLAPRLLAQARRLEVPALLVERLLPLPLRAAQAHLRPAVLRAAPALGLLGLGRRGRRREAVHVPALRDELRVALALQALLRALRVERRRDGLVAREGQLQQGRVAEVQLALADGEAAVERGVERGVGVPRVGRAAAQHLVEVRLAERVLAGGEVVRRQAHVRLLQGPGRVRLRRQARRGRRVPQDDLEVEPLHHDAAARLAPAPPERGGSPRRRAAAERRRQAKRRLHLRAPLGGPEVRGLAARLHHGDGLERRRGPALALPPAGLGRLAAFPERHPSYSSWFILPGSLVARGSRGRATLHEGLPGWLLSGSLEPQHRASAGASCGADSKRGTGDASPCPAPADGSRGGARSAAWRLVRVSS